MTFSLTILGSSSALPTSKRFSTAQALNVNENYYLIDCGEGTQIQLRRNSIRFGKLNHIFISHLHGDHYLGIFGLISTFTLLKRKSDLHIYAHETLREMLDCQLKYQEGDLPFRIVFHPLKPDYPEKLLEDKRIMVYSFPLNHRIKTCGFLFQEKPRELNIKKDMIERYNIPIAEIVKIKKGSDFTTQDGKTIKNQELTLPPMRSRSYAFCTDTLYHEPIIPIIKGVDILYHEATFADDMKKRAEETYHSTAKQAAAIAKKAQVKKLIIGHFSARYKSIDKILSEACRIFPNTVPANDDDTHHIELQRVNET